MKQMRNQKIVEITETPRNGVDAAELVGTILDALLRIPRPARLKDLEVETGIPSAKIHRYLVSMIRCGLIRRHESGNRYDFGLLAYRMGQAASHDNNVISLLEPMIEEFIAASADADLGQALGIGQWLGHGATMVRWFETNSQFSIRMKPGSDLGVTGSATAKLLAAYLPRDTTEPIVREELSAREACTTEAIEKVFKEYEQIRKRGIARSLGARRDGIDALSAPLFDHRGEVVAAITVLGMSPHFDTSLNGSAASSLLALSKKLSAWIGSA
jgi:DNA-binding IclR family transcriptional regulator